MRQCAVAVRGGLPGMCRCGWVQPAVSLSGLGHQSICTAEEVNCRCLSCWLIIRGSTMSSCATLKIHGGES